MYTHVYGVHRSKSFKSQCVGPRGWRVREDAVIATSSSHSKNSLSNIWSKGWVRTDPNLRLRTGCSLVIVIVSVVIFIINLMIIVIIIIMSIIIIIIIISSSSSSSSSS